ncbi:MAG TPA: LLM class flavin-dependent oxidoreductase, partial [Candidatus Tectomicrobia bacterium]|nr:LLM class flavin-dependent oxidoreductase [Candidatus Tectomicrobia bacterium]
MTSWTDDLGVALLGHGLPAGAPSCARAAERAGLGSLWLIEDYYHPGAYALAGAAAAATERIVIGLGVVNPYTRHPALVAMETAALAGLAPGRVVLGLGSSNRRWIEAQMSIPFKTPLRGLREGVEIVRRLLDGERVTCTGDVFSVRDVALETPPAERIPILLGVKGPKALALAREIADGVHCSILASPAHVRRVRATAGAGAGFIVIAYVPVAVSDDRAEARAWMRPLLARYLGALHGQSILEDAGLPAARTQSFRDALAGGRLAADLVTDDLVDAVAIAGTPADCRAALARWAEAGLDGLVAVVPEGADFARQVERLGREVSPAW